MDLNNKRVIISRTDSIGDVMLTLPICAWLKNEFPETEIIFLGKGYTKPIVEAYTMVDRYEDWNEYQSVPKAERIEKFRALKADVIIHVFPNKEIAALAKKAKLTVRIGTSHRAYHIVTCTHRLNFTRKKSNLHEAQLNHELLRPFGLTELPKISDLEATTKFFQPKAVELPKEFSSLSGFTILHPKSQGSAMEWPVEKYIELAKILVGKGEKVVFTGTKDEGDLFRERLPKDESIIDTTGKLSLEQLIVLIGKATNFVSCSTGPMHIAGYLGINTIGLFSPKRPIHPGRWKAIGSNVKTLVLDEKCENCAKGKKCNCIENISVQSVLEKLT